MFSQTVVAFVFALSGLQQKQARAKKTKLRKTVFLKKNKKKRWCVARKKNKQTTFVLFYNFWTFCFCFFSVPALPCPSPSPAAAPLAQPGPKNSTTQQFSALNNGKMQPLQSEGFESPLLAMTLSLLFNGNESAITFIGNDTLISLCWEWVSTLFLKYFNIV